VVALVPADRHQRVGALREHVRHQVFQIAYLVAAVVEAGVAVLALRPDPRATEVRAEPVERMDRARAER
jgi:hypothetical protein